LYKAQQFRTELSPSSNAKHPWIPFDTKEGRDYWEALQIVREWTKLNHTILHDLVRLKVFKTIDVETFWNEHNFVFKKDDLFYHAKGATPLDDIFVPDSYNGLRLIPMNMRDGILIVKGETTHTNLGFANHGAGRLMSRTEYTKKALANKTGHELFLEETAGLDIRFFTGKMDISELPGAYKSAETIQKQMKQFGLGEVVDMIKPYGCIMCGHDNRSWKHRKRKS
jgi:RNA-splicing ligase RtcB